MVMRILYVEDNDIVQELTCEMLARADRTIVACGSAEDALAQFVTADFDLVITDVSLPKMSGLDFVREVKRLQPAIAIIVATGYELHAGLSDWGADVRFINKPFESEQLDALIAATDKR